MLQTKRPACAGLGPTTREISYRSLRSSSSSRSRSTRCEHPAQQPVLLPHTPAPTAVVSPPVPTTETGADCGTKIRLRLESAATECEPDDCGIVSISTLVASITPRTAACAGQPEGAQLRFEPV